MLTPTLYFNETYIPRNCHGLLALEYGASLVGHSGNTVGCSSNLALDIKNGIGVFIMTNEVGETTYNYGLLSLIFGDYMADTDFCKEELKGIYCSVRSNFQTGLFKIYGTIGGLLPLVPNKNGTYHVLGQAEVKQVAKQGCIMDDGNGTRMYLAIGRDENNQIISLQGMGTDYYKVNVLLFLGKFLLLLSLKKVFKFLSIHFSIFILILCQSQSYRCIKYSFLLFKLHRSIISSSNFSNRDNTYSHAFSFRG